MKNAICQCNKCNILMYDDNPDVDQPSFTDEELKAFNIHSMILNQDVEDDAFKACPICRDDAYLQDVNLI